MGSGQKFTVPAALYLTERYHDSALQVFYDHGGHLSQRTYSWFGSAYTAPFAAQHLSWIDIIVAEPKTHKIHQIIEIEDSTASPKTIIADVMAVLLGDGLAFAGHSDWQVGNWTSLIVLAHVSTIAAQAKYHARLDHIHQQIVSFQTGMKTRNAAIDHLVLETFKSTNELQAKLPPVCANREG